jgi:hypothetical protein
MKRMRWTLISLLALAVVTAAAVAPSAAAKRGPGKLGRAGATALVNEAAERLNLTAARLRSAIVDAAIARIDEAVREDDLGEDDATELKDAARDNVGLAMAISRTRTVAANAGVTVDRLNNAFRAARKALIIARIDKAVRDGDLTAAQAARLKEDLEDVELPGYKAFHGPGFGGVRLGFGPGPFRR